MLEAMLRSPTDPCEPSVDSPLAAPCRDTRRHGEQDEARQEKKRAVHRLCRLCYPGAWDTL